MDDLSIDQSRGLYIPADEIRLSAIRSGGPGGQHVNKTATGIQLQFNIGASSLPDDIKQRLLNRNDHRISKEGTLTLQATQSRSQEQNRKSALDNLQKLIQQALHPPRPRKKTKPSKASLEKRLQRKKLRGQLKKDRAKIPPQN